jgi:DtxR family Mn-dependent transcriptional regulator
MSELIDTAEMYLRTIYQLLEQGVPPRRARIVESLGQAAPTVSETVARLERDGVLRLGPDHVIELTEPGLQLASEVMRRHRLAECLLIQVLDVGWAAAHQEACRWEHVISSQVMRNMDAFLGGPRVTPYGTPVPEVGERPETFAHRWTPLADALPQLIMRGTQTELVAVDDNVQSNTGLLGELDAAGLHPGASLSAQRGNGGQVRLHGPAGTAGYTEALGRGAYVAA